MSLCDKHIPKIKIKSKGSPPWFDSDMHKACRKKKDIGPILKPPQRHCIIRNIKSVERKLNKNQRKSNFDDTSNLNIITKKFWSYVKSSSNTSRIPDVVSHSGCFKSTAIDKANLFNKYFCDQFSSPSHYNIDIDFNQDIFCC